MPSEISAFDPGSFQSVKLPTATSDSSNLGDRLCHGQNLENHVFIGASKTSNGSEILDWGGSHLWWPHPRSPNRFVLQFNLKNRNGLRMGSKILWFWFPFKNRWRRFREHLQTGRLSEETTDSQKTVIPRKCRTTTENETQRKMGFIPPGIPKQFSSKILSRSWLCVIKRPCQPICRDIWREETFETRGCVHGNVGGKNWRDPQQSFRIHNVQWREALHVQF